MNHHVVIATHHKSGTNWMGGVFRMIAEELGVPYVNLSQISPIPDRQAAIDDAPDPAEAPMIFFHGYGRFPTLTGGRRRFRGLHVVRDPRDMILSAAKYHTWSEESWLHDPKEEYGGKTYQEAINAHDSEVDRIRFEMENNSTTILNKMADFDLQDCMYDVRYEDMRQDINLMLWHRLCLRLSFDAEDLPVCFRAFIKHSIQFGNVKNKKHIQDTSVSRWPEKFPKELLGDFSKKFGHVIKRFDYPETVKP